MEQKINDLELEDNDFFVESVTRIPSEDELFVNFVTHDFRTFHVKLDTGGTSECYAHRGI